MGEGDDRVGAGRVTSKKAPKREDGTYFYVVVTSGWGRTRCALVAATSLAEAKAKHGWTRERYVTVRVHRATVAEVESFPDWRATPAARSDPS